MPVGPRNASCTAERGHPPLQLVKGITSVQHKGSSWVWVLQSRRGLTHGVCNVSCPEYQSELPAPQAVFLCPAGLSPDSVSPAGYEGVSEFFTDLLNHITTILQDPNAGQAAAGDSALPRPSRLPAEQAGSPAAEWMSNASPSSRGSKTDPEPPWTAEADAGGAAKLPHQRLGCTAAVSPSFQHCVASLATKASSQ